jgi:integrase
VSVTRDPLANAEEYATWVRRTGLADQSQRAYAVRVTAFCRWLAEHADDYGSEVWTDEHVRDYAVRDYRRILLTGPGRWRPPASPPPVRGRLAVHLVRHRQAAGARRRATADEFKGLDDDEVRKVLRAAERAGPRDHALVALGVLAGPRVGEIVPLDADDIAITERSGVVSIRYGKGGKPRRVPLPPQAREALSAWQAERRTLPAAERCPALFLSVRGDRLAQRSIQHAVHQVGATVGIRLYPHKLRHTFARRWIESGGDIPSLQRVLGHASPKTTMIYAKPSWADLEEQAEAQHVDY